MSWLDGLTVLYVTALAGATGCGAFVRAVRLRHREDERLGGPL